MKIRSKNATILLLALVLAVITQIVGFDNQAFGADPDIVSVKVNGIDSESAEIDCQEAILQVVWGTDHTTTHVYSRDAAYFDGVPWWWQGPNECNTLFENVEFPRGYANQLKVTIRARSAGGQLVEGSRTVTVMGTWTYNQYDFQDLELAPIAPPPPPDKPTLVNPPNGATFSTDTAIELQWSAANRATQYFVELFTPNGTQKPPGKMSSTAWYVGTLAPGNYEWHVEAYDSADNYSGWTASYYFSVVAAQPPDQPNLVNPPDSAMITLGTEVELQWSAANRATQYNVELFTPTGIQKPPSKLSGTAWNLGILAAGSYDWHVEAYDSNGVYSGWSQKRRFTITSPTADTCPGQYRAEYFDNQTLSGNPVFTQCESWPIDHDWGYDGPGFGISGDNFSVRWTGRAFFESTVYDVYYQSDDGMRWWIEWPDSTDEVPDEDNWNNPLLFEQHKAFHQPIANDQDIKVEYYNSGGYARAMFRWEAQPSTGPIAGRVIDSNGNGIEGVSVRAMAGSGGPERITAADGTFRFDALATHEYTVVPAKEGYTFTPSSEWVVVHSDKSEAVEFVGTANQSKQWTLLYYIAADNNLDSSERLRLAHLKEYAGQSNFNIGVLFDGEGQGDSEYWGIAESIMHIPKGELNTGDPETLSDFIIWGRETLPSTNVAVVISGHGNLSGVAIDDSSGSILEGDYLNLKELDSAFEKATLTHGKIDVLFMDACLMATIESAYQVYESVDFYVASQSLSHANFEILSKELGTKTYLDLMDIPGTPKELANDIASTNAHIWEQVTYGGNHVQYTISVAQLSVLPELVGKINTLSNLLKDRMNILSVGIASNVLSQVQRFDSGGLGGIGPLDELVDLYDFLTLLETNIEDSDIKEASRAVRESLDTYIIYESHRSGVIIGERDNNELDRSHGVSIFFPNRSRSFYTSINLDFAEGTSWEQGAIVQTAAAAQGSTWGQMLVAYVQATNPDAPDDPTMPALVAPAIVGESNRLMLPLLSRVAECSDLLTTKKVWSGTLTVSCDQGALLFNAPSIRLYAASPSIVEYYSGLIFVQPNWEYRVNYWVKTDLSIDGAELYGRLVVAQYNHNATEIDAIDQNRIDSGFSLGESVGGRTDWQQKTYVFKTNGDTHAVRLRAILGGPVGTATGSMWINGESIEKVDCFCASDLHW